MRHAFDTGERRRPPTLDYASPRPKPPTARPYCWLLLAGVSLLLLAVLFWSLIPHLNVCRAPATRLISASNLRQIGQGARMYARDHGGRFPDSFATLVNAVPDLAPRVFVSPLGNETPASSHHAMLTQPGHISYRWVGTGLTYTPAVTPSPNVLAYDDAARPQGNGTAVLYADGSVRWETEQTVRSLLTQAQARLAGLAPDSPPAAEPASTSPLPSRATP